MRLGVRECVDVCFKALANMKIGNHVFKKGEPVIYFDTVTTSELTGESTTVYAQGGRGNSRLIAWEGEKNVTFTFTDSLISPVGMAILTGAGLIQADGTEANAVFGHETVSIIATENGKVTLTSTDPTIYVPAADGEVERPVYIMLLDENGEMSGTAVKIEKDKITTGGVVIESELIKAGDRIMVDYYHKYMTDAMRIEITPEQFAGYFYIEGSTLYRREVDGVDIPAEIIIPKGKVQTAFTFTMASSGDPSTFDFTVDAFPGYIKGGNKKVLAAIQLLKADDNYDADVPIGAGEVTYKRYQYNDDTEGFYFGTEAITNDDTNE